MRLGCLSPTQAQHRPRRSSWKPLSFFALRMTPGWKTACQRISLKIPVQKAVA